MWGVFSTIKSDHYSFFVSSKSAVCVCPWVLSHDQFFLTPWTVAHQVPLYMGFSRQEYWSTLPCHPLGDLSNPGMELESSVSPVLAGMFFTTSAAWETKNAGCLPKRWFIHVQSLNRVWLFVTPMDCSPPASSVHRFFQARIPEWVAMLYSRGSSRPRVKFTSPELASGFFPLLSYLGSSQVLIQVPTEPQFTIIHTNDICA